MSKKLNLQNCIEFAAIKGGKCLSTEYVSNRILMTWKCDKEHIWATSFAHIKTGTWCPECAGYGPSKKKTLQDCIDAATENDGLCLSQEYVGIHNLMKWQCSENHQWQASFNNIKRGSWCPECFGSKKYTLNDCIKVARERGGKCLSNEYVNVRQYMLWQCKKGHRWEAQFDKINNQKSWCPYCFNLISKPQQEIYNYLISIFPTLNIVLNDTQTIKPMHLDIYIPSLKIAIEYDGWYFHHSEQAIKKGIPGRDKRKEQICKDKDITLLRLTGTERGRNWQQEKLEIKQKVAEFISNYKEL